MLKTYSNTIELMGISWRLLNKNRQLLVLPAISGLVIIAILAISAGVLTIGGAFEATADGEPSFRLADYLMFVVIYFALSFSVIYFNAALVSAAYDLLSGQKPTVRGALDAAYLQMPVILGWAFFVTTIGLIIDRIRDGGGLFAIA